jgi:hypothetical protein
VKASNLRRSIQWAGLRRAGQLQFVTSRRSGGCQKVVTNTTGCGVVAKSSEFPANADRRLVLAPIKMGGARSPRHAHRP